MRAKCKDKFTVGQRVVLVLDKDTGWQRLNGELGVVIGPKLIHHGSCATFENRHMFVGVPASDERYKVRWRDGINHFCEEHLRAIYEGEKLSTWEKFAKLTGLRISEELRQ